MHRKAGRPPHQEQPAPGVLPTTAAEATHAFADGDGGAPGGISPIGRLAVGGAIHDAEERQVLEAVATTRLAVESRTLDDAAGTGARAASTGQELVQAIGGGTGRIGVITTWDVMVGAVQDVPFGGHRRLDLAAHA